MAAVSCYGETPWPRYAFSSWQFMLSATRQPPNGAGKAMRTAPPSPSGPSVGEAQHQRAHLLGRDAGLLLERAQTVSDQVVVAELGGVWRCHDVQGAVFKQLHAQ